MTFVQTFDDDFAPSEVPLLSLLRRAYQKERLHDRGRPGHACVGPNYP